MLATGAAGRAGPADGGAVRGSTRLGHAASRPAGKSPEPPPARPTLRGRAAPHLGWPSGFPELKEAEGTFRSPAPGRGEETPPARSPRPSAPWALPPLCLGCLPCGAAQRLLPPGGGGGHTVCAALRALWHSRARSRAAAPRRAPREDPAWPAPEPTVSTTLAPGEVGGQGARLGEAVSSTGKSQEGRPEAPGL